MMVCHINEWVRVLTKVIVIFAIIVLPCDADTRAHRNLSWTVFFNTCCLRLYLLCFSHFLLTSWTQVFFNITFWLKTEHNNQNCSSCCWRDIEIFWCSCVEHVWRLWKSLKFRWMQKPCIRLKPITPPNILLWYLYLSYLPDFCCWTGIGLWLCSASADGGHAAFTNPKPPWLLYLVNVVSKPWPGPLTPPPTHQVSSLSAFLVLCLALSQESLDWCKDPWLHRWKWLQFSLSFSPSLCPSFTYLSPL